MSRPVSHRARTRTSVLLAAVLTLVVVVFNPTTTGDRLRSMLGIGQDLTFTITDNGAGNDNGDPSRRPSPAPPSP